MKRINWKYFFVTAFITLLPVLLGVALWDRLPDSIAIHFNIHNQPDNFASKPFAVFGLPLLMVVLHLVYCLGADTAMAKQGAPKKFGHVMKWIIPIMSVVLQVAILGYSLGWNFEIHRVASLVAGGLLIVVGNYLPKFDKVKNFNVTPEKARKINRFIGFTTVILGLLFIIGAFFPPTITVVCLLLMIPYTILCLVYPLYVARK